jgi:hypothetical protein
MDKNHLSGLSPLWLISLAMILGTMIIVLLPVSIVGGDSIKSSDWIGFAGNIVAGVMTLIGAAIAWFAVQRQINLQETNRIQAQQEAKVVGVIVLSKPVHAASALLYAIQIASAANNPAAVSKWDNVVQQATNQVAGMLDHFAVRQISTEMEVNDRALFLMVVTHLATMVSIYMHPYGVIDRQTTLATLETQLRSLRAYLEPFDAELWETFERDGNLPGA